MIPSIIVATRALQIPLTYPTKSPWTQVTIAKNNISVSRSVFINHSVAYSVVRQ